jgi:hypothetical protein
MTLSIVMGRSTTRVQNDHWRAHWAEWGTRPNRIEPEDQEAIETPEGPRAGAKHPGYPGAHMLSRAAIEPEHEQAITMPEGPHGAMRPGRVGGRRRGERQGQARDQLPTSGRFPEVPDEHAAPPHCTKKMPCKWSAPSPRLRGHARLG